MAEQQDATFIPLIAEVYGSLHDDFIAFLKRLSFLAEEDDGCAWSRMDALVSMSSAIGVAIQRGNVQILDRVNSNNRRAGLVVSRSQALLRVAASRPPSPSQASKSQAARSDQTSLSVLVPARPVAAGADGFGADAGQEVRPLPDDDARDPAGARVIFPLRHLAAVAEANSAHADDVDGDGNAENGSALAPEVNAHAASERRAVR